MSATRVRACVQEEDERYVVLIDGDCGLCRASETWAKKRDTKNRFRFHTLQSPQGQKWLERVGLPLDTLDTMVLIEGDKPYLRSTASLRISRRLGAPWPTLYAFMIVPRPLRDAVYRFVARNRHRFKRPGAGASCTIHGQGK